MYYYKLDMCMNNVNVYGGICVCACVECSSSNSANLSEDFLELSKLQSQEDLTNSSPAQFISNDISNVSLPS